MQAPSTPLTRRAWFSIAALGLIMGVLILGAAGTVTYVQGWIYLVVFLGASAWTTHFLLVHDPALLARRMRGGPFAEERGSQRIIMTFASIGFVALIVVPALDHRWNYPMPWTHVSPPLEWLGVVLTILGFYGILSVYRVNSYAAATIQVDAQQKVVSTGPYAYVRHPMYATATLMLAGTPLTLGSWLGFGPLLIIVPVLVWRLFDEERMLEHSLSGYADYCRKVRWRLIPRVF